MRARKSATLAVRDPAVAVRWRAAWLSSSGAHSARRANEQVELLQHNARESAHKLTAQSATASPARRDIQTRTFVPVRALLWSSVRDVERADAGSLKSPGPDRAPCQAPAAFLPAGAGLNMGRLYWAW